MDDSKDFNYDTEDPLRRCEGESLRANNALRDYALMGSGRSLRSLLRRYRDQLEIASGSEQPPSKRLQTLLRWSSSFGWQLRVEAWERLQRSAEDRLWAERRTKIREGDWTQGESLRDLADKILAESPNFIKTKRKLVKGSPKIVTEKGAVLDQGTPDREVITLALDGQLLIKSALTGSQLQRLAAEMETERSAQNVTASLGIGTGQDLTDLTNEQLQSNLIGLAGLIQQASTRRSLSANNGVPKGIDQKGEGTGTADA